MPPCSSRTHHILTFSVLLISLCVVATIAVVVSAANPANAPASTLAPLVAPPNCAPPGVQALSDSAGDQTGAPAANQQLDARAVSIAEQYPDSSSPGKLVVTMKVQSLDPANLPLNSTWQTNFNVAFPDNSVTTYFVTAATNSAANPTGISYNFGFRDTVSNLNLTTDTVTGSLNGTGATLTVVLPLELVKKPVAGAGQSTLTGPVADLSAGKTITNINFTTSTLIGVAGNGISATIDTTSSGTYTFAGIIACNGAPTPTPTPTATPTPTPAGGPRFHNFAAPNGMGSGAGEPSIGVNWQTGRAMYIANLRTLRITFDDCFSPAKALWEDKSAANTSARTLDPILFTDHLRASGDTTPNRTIVSQLSGTTSLSSYTDDDGET